MQDTAILAAALSSREAYDRIQGHVADSDLTPTVGFWFKILREAYDRDRGATRLDAETLVALGQERIPSPKQKDSLLGVVSALVPPASPLNVVQICLELKRKNLTAEFASASMAGDRKKASKLLASLNEIWEADTFEAKETAIWHDASDTLRLFERVGSDSRVPFGCPSICARVGGGVLPGHHVGIFGRTEIGKSTFVIDVAARLVKNNQRVLYIGNEDQIDILKLRMLGRVLQKSQAELEADPKAAAKAFEEYEERLLMTQLYAGDVDAIHKRVSDWKPTVLVIDQFRNLSGTDDGMTQRMEANAIKLRALLLSESLIGVSVTQANDRSERHGQEAPIYLGTGDIDSSRVGLPGQCDLLLGIGANSDLKARGQRYISFAKNKLSSARDSHEGVLVNFDLAISRVS